MTVSLGILHKLPTPYNDGLFQSLDRDSRFDVQVFHLWEGSWRRPWETSLGTEYDNTYLSGWRGIDLPFLWSTAIRRDAPDWLMIGDWAHFVSVAAAFLRWMGGMPYAIWADTPQEQFSRPLWKRGPRRMLIRALLSRADLVLVSGRIGVQRIIDLGGQAERTVNFPFFVPIPDSAPSLPCLEYPGVRTILFAGTLEERKGVDLAIRALAALEPADRRRLWFRVAGTGPELVPLQRLSRDLGVAGMVEWLGWLEPSEMSEQLSRTDILLHPARRDPFPLVVLEAMAAGRVVVASDASGSALERLTPGESGYLFPSEDVEALTRVLGTMARSPVMELQGIADGGRAVASKWPYSRANDMLYEVMADSRVRRG